MNILYKTEIMNKIRQRLIEAVGSDGDNNIADKIIDTYSIYYDKEILSKYPPSKKVKKLLNDLKSKNISRKDIYSKRENIMKYIYGVNNHNLDTKWTSILDKNGFKNGSLKDHVKSMPKRLYFNNLFKWLDDQNRNEKWLNHLYSNFIDTYNKLIRENTMAHTKKHSTLTKIDLYNISDSIMSIFDDITNYNFYPLLNNVSIKNDFIVNNVIKDAINNFNNNFSYVNYSNNKNITKALSIYLKVSDDIIINLLDDYINSVGKIDNKDKILLTNLKYILLGDDNICKFIFGKLLYGGSVNDVNSINNLRSELIMIDLYNKKLSKDVKYTEEEDYKKISEWMTNMLQYINKYFNNNPSTETDNKALLNKMNKLIGISNTIHGNGVNSIIKLLNELKIPVIVNNINVTKSFDSSALNIGMKIMNELVAEDKKIILVHEDIINNGNKIPEVDYNGINIDKKTSLLNLPNIYATHYALFFEKLLDGLNEKGIIFNNVKTLVEFILSVIDPKRIKEVNSNKPLKDEAYK